MKRLLIIGSVFMVFVDFSSCKKHLSSPLVNDAQSVVQPELSFSGQHENRPLSAHHCVTPEGIMITGYPDVFKCFNITHMVENAMEEIKTDMKTGNATFQIPILDPYEFHEENIIYNDSLKLYGKLDGVMSNLSTITWTRLYACLFSLVMQVDFALNDILLEGSYDLDGSLYDIFPLYGSGNFSFRADKLNVTLTTQFQPQRGDMPIHVEIAKVNLNTIEGARWDLGDILGGGTLSEIVNNFTNDISIPVINRIMGLIEDVSSNVLGVVLEDALNSRNTTVPDIVNYLLSFPNSTMPMEKFTIVKSNS